MILYGNSGPRCAAPTASTLATGRRYEGHTLRDQSRIPGAPARSVCLARQRIGCLHIQAMALAFGAGSLVGALLGAVQLLLR